MGIFRSRTPAVSPARGDDQPQPPDELAAEAAQFYAAARFSAAADSYGRAVDKLHTMYVLGNFTYRQPSARDLGILNGLVSAVGAARAQDGPTAAKDAVQSAVHYLREIAQEAQARGYDHAMYLGAAAELAGL